MQAISQVEGEITCIEEKDQEQKDRKQKDKEQKDQEQKD